MHRGDDGTRNPTAPAGEKRARARRYRPKAAGPPTETAKSAAGGTATSFEPRKPPAPRSAPASGDGGSAATISRAQTAKSPFSAADGIRVDAEPIEGWAPVLCDAVRRALDECVAGLALKALDASVHLATGYSLAQWTCAINVACAASTVGGGSEQRWRDVAYARVPFKSFISAPVAPALGGRRGSDRARTLLAQGEKALSTLPGAAACCRLSQNVGVSAGDSRTVRADAAARRGRRFSCVSLVRNMTVVGSIERIAGHVVVYPASTLVARSTDMHMRSLATCARADPYGRASSYALCHPRNALPVNVLVVDTVEACVAAVLDLRRQGVLALDCEGTAIAQHGSASPGVALVQMMGVRGPCYLFDLCNVDPRHSGARLMKRGGLGCLLADPLVIKVVHDAREDARALDAAYGCRIASVFDTQAAHMQRPGFYGQRPGLNALLAHYGFDVNRHKDAMRTVYPLDQWCWHRRPLPAWMIEYAVADVRRLLDLRSAIVAQTMPTDFFMAPTTNLPVHHPIAGPRLSRNPLWVPGRQNLDLLVPLLSDGRCAVRDASTVAPHWHPAGTPSSLPYRERTAHWPRAGSETPPFHAWRAVSPMSLVPVATPAFKRVPFPPVWRPESGGRHIHGWQSTDAFAPPRGYHDVCGRGPLPPPAHNVSTDGAASAGVVAPRMVIRRPVSTVSTPLVA